MVKGQESTSVVWGSLVRPGVVLQMHHLTFVHALWIGRLKTIQEEPLMKERACLE